MEKLYATHYVDGFKVPTNRIDRTLEKAKKEREGFEALGIHVQFIEVITTEERFLALFEQYVDAEEESWFRFGGEPTTDTWEEALAEAASIWIDNKFPGWQVLEKKYSAEMSVSHGETAPFLCDDDEEDMYPECMFLPDN